MHDRIYVNRQECIILYVHGCTKMKMEIWKAMAKWTSLATTAASCAVHLEWEEGTTRKIWRNYGSENKQYMHPITNNECLLQQLPIYQ